MSVTVWKGMTIGNEYTSDNIEAYRCGNSYYFKNTTTGAQSKEFFILFDGRGLEWKWYLNLQIKKYSKRKKKFIESGLQSS